MSIKLIFLKIICSALLISCQSYQSGESTYEAYCVNCHMEDGSGLLHLIPPLNRPFKRTTTTQLICLIRLGQPSPDSSTQLLPMPPFPQLSNIDVANVLNYIHWKWQPGDVFLTSDQVQKALNSCR